MQPAEALERTWDVDIVGVQNSLAGRELVYQRFFWVGTFVVVEALGQSRLIPCLLTQQTCQVTSVGISAGDIVVDALYKFKILADAYTDELNLLADAYTDGSIIEHYVSHIKNHLFAHARVAVLSGDRDSAPLAVALLSTKCRNKRPGCSCAHLGLWAIVTLERSRGHARRLSAALRVHAKADGCDHVLAYVANRDKDAFFAKLAYDSRGASADQQSLPGIKVLAAAADPERSMMT